MIEKLFKFEKWDWLGPTDFQILDAVAQRNFGRFQVGKLYSCVAFIITKGLIECYDDDGALLFTEKVEFAICE